MRTRGRPGPFVVVSARLDRYAVITRVEMAVLDQHVLAAFGIAAVIVRSVGCDVQISDRHVLAEHRVDFPHRRIDYRHALDEYVLALVRLDELRPEIMAETKHTFGDRRPARTGTERLR